MHLLTTKNLTSVQLDTLFKETDFIRKNPWHISGLAHDLILAIIKDEGSTRTRVSFEVAMKRLGGETTLLELDNNSSISKGESVEDTIRTMSEYVDAIVMRHSRKGIVQHCSQFSLVPVINAGDGDGEHPTQALLDVYTIHREVGRLDYLNIVFVGDLKCSRTVHSLVNLLSIYPGNVFYFVSPQDMKMPKEYLPNNNFIEEESLSEVLKYNVKFDILYMTRFQVERRKRMYGYLSTAESTPYYSLNEEDIGRLKDCKVLHPLPRNGEIPTSFDSDPRAAYFRQAKNGMFIRMALLNNLFLSKSFFARTLA